MLDTKDHIADALGGKMGDGRWAMGETLARSLARMYVYISVWYATIYGDVAEVYFLAATAAVVVFVFVGAAFLVVLFFEDGADSRGGTSSRLWRAARRRL